MSTNIMIKKIALFAIKKKAICWNFLNSVVVASCIFKFNNVLSPLSVLFYF